jgi:hypothetical protein
VQAYVQPLPPPAPTSKWRPDEVVLGFLHASASYAFDPAAARQYLVPELRKGFHPGRGVTVVAETPTVTPAPYNPKEENLGGGLSVPQKVVRFTGQQLATVSQSGQYQYAPGNVNITFVLAKNANGVWLIEQLPLHTLMLTESDFEEVYQPRNLFFFADAPASELPNLVPDPVYAPQQSQNSALNTDLATGLVNGLLKGQGGWLSGATSSAFPRGTRLLRKVTITGKTAQVDLGGAAAHAPQSARQEMAEQLLATLSDGEYSLPLASNLQLYINNKPQAVYRAGNLVPMVPSGPIQIITGTGSVGQLPPEPVRGDKPQARIDPGQIGSATVTAVAASPLSDHQLAVATTQGAGGCTVDVQPGGQGAYKPYPLTTSGGGCTSLSYDANGNLWASAGGSVWVLQPNRAPVAVDMSAMAAAIQPGEQILALQMAPDKVRAALLVSTPSAPNRLLLAAVHFQGGSAMLGQPVTVGTTGLTDPQAISWYDPYHLAVLAGGGIYEVPLTTGAGQQTPPLLSLAQPGALTLTTDGHELVVGTEQGIYAEAVSSPGSWSLVANGTDPVYPG